MFFNTKTLKNDFKFSVTMPVVQVTAKIQEKLNLYTNINIVDVVPELKLKNNSKITEATGKFLKNLKQIKQKNSLDDLMYLIEELIIDYRSLVFFHPALKNYLNNIRKILDFAFVELLKYQQNQKLCIANTYKFLNPENKKPSLTVIDWNRGEPGKVFYVNQHGFKKPKSELILNDIENFLNKNGITNKSIKAFLLDHANQNGLFGFSSFLINELLMTYLEKSSGSIVAQQVGHKIEIFPQGKYEANFNFTLFFNVKSLTTSQIKNSQPIPVHTDMLLTQKSVNEPVQLTGVKFFIDPETEKAINTIEDKELQTVIKEVLENSINQPDPWLILGWMGGNAPDEFEKTRAMLKP